MKGQMFLLAAVIIATAILAAKAFFKPSAQIERGTQALRFEKEIVENVAQELEYSFEFSYPDTEKMTLNAFNFGNFSRRRLSGHSLKLKLFLLTAVTNVTIGEMNITSINLLGESKKINLTLNTSPVQSASSELADYGIWSTNFASISAGANYLLNISYGGENKSILIKVGSRDIYTSFFDLSVEGDKALHRKFFEETYTL